MNLVHFYSARANCFTGDLFIGLIPFLGDDSEEEDGQTGEFDSENFDDIAAKARFKREVGENSSDSSIAEMHKERAKEEGSVEEESFESSSEWSRAVEDEDRDMEASGSSFREKVEEAREEIKEAPGGSGLEDEPVPDLDRQRGSEKEGPEGPGEELVPDEETEDEEEREKLSETDVEEGDSDSPAPEEEDKTIEEQLSDLDEIEEKLPSPEELEEAKESFEEQTEKMQEMIPSWDDLGDLNGRDEESVLVKADLEALKEEIEKDLSDSGVDRERVEELEEHLESVQERLGELEAADEPGPEEQKVQELEDKVEELEGELRGEEIELRNRIEELEKEMKGVRHSLGSDKDEKESLSDEFHDRAMHEEVRELRKDVKELSSAVVQISEKVFEN